MSKVCGIQSTNDLGLDLGIPIVQKRVNKAYFQYIIDKSAKEVEWVESEMFELGRKSYAYSIGYVGAPNLHHANVFAPSRHLQCSG